jgi:hypothetical protein
VIVHDLIGLLQNGETIDSLIANGLPDLTRAQVYESLVYYSGPAYREVPVRYHALRRSTASSPRAAGGYGGRPRFRTFDELLRRPARTP